MSVNFFDDGTYEMEDVPQENNIIRSKDITTTNYANSYNDALLYIFGDIGVVRSTWINGDTYYLACEYEIY